MVLYLIFLDRGRLLNVLDIQYESVGLIVGGELGLAATYVGVSTLSGVGATFIAFASPR